MNCSLRCLESIGYFSTVDRDVRYLLDLARVEIRNHFESLPFEIRKCMIGLELTIKELTKIIVSKEAEPAHRLGALSTRMQAYRFKMEILDGKAQLDEVFAYIDEEKKKREERGNGPTISEHS